LARIMMPVLPQAAVLNSEPSGSGF